MVKVRKVQTPGEYNIDAVNRKRELKKKMKRDRKKKKEQEKKKKQPVGRPVTKKRTPRKGERRKYSKDDMKSAVALVEAGMPIATAARTCGVPRITLDDCIKGRHKGGKAGRPTELTAVEEATLVDLLKLLGSFNFPLTKRHLRDMVKAYLDRKEKKTRFTNNRPGKKWASSFVKRHKDHIVIRKARNIRRSRAAVSPDEIRAYFENLAVELEGIPPTHIFNCDETNLADNPSEELCIFAKGVKYPEQGGVCEYLLDLFAYFFISSPPIKYLDLSSFCL